MLQFEEVYAPESQGSRYLIDIPLNLQEAFSVKGNFDVKCMINGISFECSPLPRGKGKYAISFTKVMQKKTGLKSGDVFTVSIAPLEKEEKKESHSSEEKEYKRIESLRLVMQNSPAACGQACVAMLAGVTIEEAIKTMKTAGPATIGQITEALDFYGIGHAPRNVRLSKKNPNLPGTALLTVHLPEYAHWVLYHQGQYFDPEFGLLDECVKEGRVTSFFEIFNCHALSPHEVK